MSDNETSAVAATQGRVSAAIDAALGGLLPATAQAAGPLPADPADYGGWMERAQAAAGMLMESAMVRLRPMMRQEAALHQTLALFEGNDSNKTLQKGTVLDVFTHRGSGVMLVQNHYIPAELHLDAEEAIRRGRAAVNAGDSAAFRGDYGGEQPGDLGAVGVERYFLGYRSEESGRLAYQAAKACKGQFSRIYKSIETTDKGKKLKTALYVEPLSGWESVASDLNDVLGEIEDYANAPDETGGELDGGAADVAALAVDDPSLPASRDEFMAWVTERNITAAQVQAAKSELGIRDKIADCHADDIRDVAERLSTELSGTAA